MRRPHPSWRQLRKLWCPDAKRGGRGETRQQARRRAQPARSVANPKAWAPLGGVARPTSSATESPSRVSGDAREIKTCARSEHPFPVFLVSFKDKRHWCFLSSNEHSHAACRYVSEGYELVSIGNRSTECDMCMCMLCMQMHMHNMLHVHVVV